MEHCEPLAKVLNVDPAMISNLDKEMEKRTGKAGVLDKIYKDNCAEIDKTLELLDTGDHSANHVRGVLRSAILTNEKELLKYLSNVEGKDEFEKAVNLSKKIARVERGFFLKKNRAEEILKKRPPQHLLEYLGVDDIEEVLAKHDVTEVFSVLRFIESEEWMHETFDVAYSAFTKSDFEERDIEVKVLGPEWHAIAKKFVAKKHHNVSHLKEFGVIFLNPIKENVPGKFLRDFSLFLHYYHEIEFYSKLFRRHADSPDFAEKLKSLLRGDVPEVYKVEVGEWLIVQRYLWKINAQDPRLFLPRVNPESMHWARGEKDITEYSEPTKIFNLHLWHNLDWVGGIFDGGHDEVVSFDLEDNAMSLVSFMEGKSESFNYHQREAMWTKIFEEFVGGDKKMEEILIENFDQGVVKFQPQTE